MAETNGKGGGSDVFLFIAFFVGLFILWLVGGGPNRPLSQAGLFTSFMPGIPSVPDSELRAGDDTDLEDTDDVQRELEDVQEELERVQAELERIKLLGETSPFEGTVTIRKSTTGLRRTNPKEEYVELRISSRNDTRLSLAGWSIENAVTKAKYTIPDAAILPQFGSVSYEQPILAAPGDSLFIVSGRSPVGVSFRTNMCTGYFEQFQDFNPSLARSCPLPREEIPFIEGGTILTNERCLNFVRTIPRCTMVLNDIPFEIDNTCRTLVQDRLNYTGCVKRHKNTSDFFGDEWYLFLKREREFWEGTHGVVKLVDPNGKTVDYYVY